MYIYVYIYIYIHTHRIAYLIVKLILDIVLAPCGLQARERAVGLSAVLVFFV